MAQISVRVDDEVKKRAEQACGALGLSLSAAINVYLVKLGKERRIPFEISDDPFYSESNLAELKKRINDVETGRAVLKEHSLIEVDE